MADPVVLSTPAIYYGGFDVTRDHNMVEVAAAFEDLDDARFGDLAKVFYPGTMQPSASGGGFFAAGSGLIDTIVGTRLGQGVSWPFSVAPIGDVDGNVVYELPVALSAYRFGAEHGRSLPFTLKHMPQRSAATQGGELVRSTVMLPKALRTVTATGTARQLGALSATQKLVAVLHVFAMTGGSLTVTVQSDDAGGFPSQATRLTFNAATGITRQILELVGPVTDDWWRILATYTPGTNYTAYVSLGITNL
jgi:hypothetical protein